jgi:NEDD8-activating enzyme E1
MDTIDVSNLNRQFLFRQKDVGGFKATVAAAFIMNRVPSCRVTALTGKIQDYDEDFYKQFKVVICGLDNIEARRWLNSLIVGLFDEEDENPVIIPIIDGGTEGFKGQARVILPKITSCFECSLESFPPQQAFPLCTIRNTPRIPEHCIAYAFIVEWERDFPTKKLDKDSPDDIQWVYEKALARAAEFGIEGVTYFKTKGVVKNIIPAVASTNAVIAAACVNEAVKILSFCSQTLNTYMMYQGSESMYTPVFEYERKSDCVVCNNKTITKLVNSSTLLQEFMDELSADAALQLKAPSLTVGSRAEGNARNLYLQGPESLREQLKPNLLKPLSELIEHGELIQVTDPALGQVSLTLKVNFFVDE